MWRKLCRNHFLLKHFALTFLRNTGQCPRPHSPRSRVPNAEEKTDWGVIKEKIRVDLKRYLNKQTSKRALILPVILEI